MGVRGKRDLVAMDEQLFLRWNDFQQNFAVMFQKMQESEDFVDVTLACDGSSIGAHKMVLAAWSPYLKKLLKSNPCTHPIVVLNHVYFSDLVLLIRFMYQGEVTLSEEQLASFLRTAQNLEIRGLTQFTHGNKSEDRSKTATSSQTSSKRESDQRSSVSSKRFKSQDLSVKTYPLESPDEDDATELITPKIEITEDISENGGSFENHHDEPMSEKCLSDEVTTRIPIHTFPSVRKDRKLKLRHVAIGTIDTSDATAEASCAQPRSERKTLPKNIEHLEHVVESQFPSEDDVKVCNFPCPFCDKEYTNWGFRRRHIKALHTVSSHLPCKWCYAILPTHEEWEKHVIADHNVQPCDAQSALMILDEANMVLQNPHPTKLDVIINKLQKSSSSTDGEKSGRDEKSSRKEDS
ncbi:unnamed protein product [Darwinula stevensoni]|uniref:BTB domain-containing protein n=1 Tax=Darwinula stevensoni TaxID=69355 RepID=A0A7R9A521_9CRUS|nr:unnamed protein product [Darwinula stevensoni]CAG0891113.1 unnamed protein product [Darwinula stevensoni]